MRGESGWTPDVFSEAPKTYTGIKVMGVLPLLPASFLSSTSDISHTKLLLFNAHT
jgi:hypothetical protein